MALILGDLVGGTGGSPFSHYGGTNGNVMQKIKVWAGPEHIRAISVWLSNGVEYTVGKVQGRVTSEEFTFNTGERVDRMSLWTNKNGDRSGWIRFTTNQGRSFDFGMTVTLLRPVLPFRQTVGSGIWAGIRGRRGDDVDALGVVFLQRIRSCRLILVNYPTLSFSGTSGTNNGSTRITQIAASTKSFKLVNTADRNESTDQLTWELDDRPDATNNVNHTWTISNPPPNTGLLQFFAPSSISVRTRTPALALRSSNVGWELSLSETESSTLSSSSSFVSPHWSRSGSLLPSGSVDVTATTETYQGNATRLPFRGSVQYTTLSNHVFNQTGIQGEYTGQSYVAPVLS